MSAGVPGFEEFIDDSTDPPVRGFLHAPVSVSGGATLSNTALILTHGAGANCQTLLLVALAEAFAAAGVAVLRCDLPFRQARPYGPPIRSAERDQAGLRSAVESLRRHSVAGGDTARIVLGGHSYGGRMASILASAEPGLADVLLLLSYPLHPPKQPQQLRTQHFPALETPALFVSGVRDGFGSVAELETALQLIPARTRLLSVPGAGHELISKANRETLPPLVVEAFRDFVETKNR